MTLCIFVIDPIRLVHGLGPDARGLLCDYGTDATGSKRRGVIFFWN